MIAGIFHQGSGLGNQLFRYVTTRVLAADKGYDFGMLYRPDGSSKEEGFKGKSFMNIDMGLPVPSVMNYWEEKKVIEGGVDIRGYDPEINFVEDNTLIDGEFQDIRYFGHRLDEVREWLDIEPPSQKMPDNLCVIGFRGGEFTTVPDLFLTKNYWEEAIKEINRPGMKFEVHTDDVATAQKFFPDFKCVHNVWLNWRSMRYAKYAIVANSSFYILPRLLNGGTTVAPRYWARRNTKVWALPQNYYREFLYI